MFIQTQETPNPQTLKFIPGITVLQNNTISYNRNEDYSKSPLAQTLFDIKEIRGVFLAKDFITITKDENSNWSTLKPIIIATIMDHFIANKPVILEKEIIKAEVQDNENETIIQIRDLINNKIRPAVAGDGGDIIYKKFENGIVYVELHGACSGCPSSTITLKNGIENMLQHYIPEVKSVEAI